MIQRLTAGGLTPSTWDPQQQAEHDRLLRYRKSDQREFERAYRGVEHLCTRPRESSQRKKSHRRYRRHHRLQKGSNQKVGIEKPSDFLSSGTSKPPRKRQRP